jgi:hypothetical protein
MHLGTGIQDASARVCKKEKKSYSYHLPCNVSILQELGKCLPLCGKAADVRGLTPGGFIVVNRDTSLIKGLRTSRNIDGSAGPKHYANVVFSSV